MILLDTNIILSFIHPDPREQDVVQKQLNQIGRGPFLMVPPVLHEVMNFAKSPQYTDRFLQLVDEMHIEFVDPGEDVPWREVLAWMRKYAEHDPDFTDAYLVVLSGKWRRHKIWTFDREFRTTWRRPDGKAVPLAVKPK